MGRAGRTLETSYTAIEWSPDASSVTKTRRPAPDARRRFRYERRVNELLRAQPPPVSTPTLLGHDSRRRSLVFSAAVGEPIGPKYPSDLSADDVDLVVGLAHRLDGYEPRRRWLRRVRTTRRLELARGQGLLGDAEAHRLIALAGRVHGRHRFAHGDLTARNVLLGGSGLVLIDWEWAGLYPADWDLAFLWFSLVDQPGGRDAVERHVGRDPQGFLLSALLIQLWHLQWYVPAAFRERHLETRDHLLERLRI